MAEYLQDKKLTQNEADRLQAPLELDLTAFYKILENDILETIDGFEGSPDQFINEVLSWFEPPVYSDSIKKSLFSKALKSMKSFRKGN